MINPETRPKRKEKILKQETPETLVLLNLDDGQYYALNEVGGRVWDLCDGSYRVSELVATICQEYDAPDGVVEADVLELLEELADAGLLAAAS
ncbi:MAG: PqqD family protein [Deinococcota bacterium]|jgi:hypothetical protein|nr:PqqD family protein [Deinococcota bacterium]